MDNIPTGYIIFIYGIMILPYAMTAMAIISAVAALTLYAKNRRKLAFKILKISGLILLIFVIFILLTKSSLGI